MGYTSPTAVRWPYGSAMALRQGTMSDMPEEELLEVIRREKLLLDPALRASAEDVAALLHPDFVEFGASGRIWDGEAIVAALSSDPASGESTDFRAVALGADVVLLTYRIRGERGSLSSSVWVLDPVDGWRLRFHQGTPHWRDQWNGELGTGPVVAE